MLTQAEQNNIDKGTCLKQHCKTLGCGTLIWEAPSERFLPRYDETLICPNCGSDNSRKAPLIYRLKTSYRRWKRKIIVKLVS